jgi:hypothetical protein
VSSIAAGGPVRRRTATPAQPDWHPLSGPGRRLSPLLYPLDASPARPPPAGRAGDEESAGVLKITRLFRKGRMLTLKLEGEIWLPSSTWTPRELNRSVTPCARASRAPHVRASSRSDYTWTTSSSAPESKQTYCPGRTQAAGCGTWSRRGTLYLILDPTRAPGPRPPGSQAQLALSRMLPHLDRLDPKRSGSRWKWGSGWRDVGPRC